MAATDLDEVITQDHLALEAFMRGDPEPKKRLYSHRDDATLSNPFRAAGPRVGGHRTHARRSVRQIA